MGTHPGSTTGDEADPGAEPGPKPLAGRAVCVVGMNYAPEHTGIAPYTTGLAEMAVELGARVEVLCGVPHYPAWQVAPGHRWRLRSRSVVSGVEVRRARHFVPSRPTAPWRLLWDGSYVLNAGLMRPRRRPDAVIAVTPSPGGAALGVRWARAFRSPLGIVVQDLVGQAAVQSGMAGGDRIAGVVRRVEASLLRRADRVAVISQGFRAQLEEYGVEPARIVHFPNWTHIEPVPIDRAAVRRRLGWPDDVFVVLHTGNMGLKQDLGNVIEAARLAGEARDVLFVLMGDGSRRAELEAAGQGVGALRFHPPVPDALYPQALAAADLLLVNELPSVGEMSLPSKLTSYFAAGRAVLGAVSEGGACAREMDATGGAAQRVEPGRPAELLEAVHALRRDPDRLAGMGAVAADYAEATLGRTRARRAVADLVTELIGAGPPTGRRSGAPAARP